MVEERSNSQVHSFGLNCSKNPKIELLRDVELSKCNSLLEEDEMVGQMVVVMEDALEDMEEVVVVVIKLDSNLHQNLHFRSFIDLQRYECSFINSIL